MKIMTTLKTKMNEFGNSVIEAKNYLKSNPVRISAAILIPLMSAMPVYAAENISAMVTSSIDNLITTVINGLAVFLLIIGMILGGIAIYHIGNGVASGQAGGQNQGMNSILPAIAALLAAAVLIGMQDTITNFITAFFK